MLRVDVSKNSRTALSSKEGEFVTSTTTSAPASAPDSPSPVRVLTPEEGEAGTASWPAPRSRGTSFLPMSPLPPITTIFIPGLLECRPGRIAGPAFLFPSLFLLFGDDDALGVLRVQYDGCEPTAHRSSFSASASLSYGWRESPGCRSLLRRFPPPLAPAATPRP